MSTFEKTKNIRLQVIPIGNYRYLVKVLLFDFRDRIIDPEPMEGFNALYLLSKGIYTLRIEMNGEIKDEVIFVEKDMEYLIDEKKSFWPDGRNVIEAPRQYSSALLGDAYKSSHEYYTAPAMQWSRKHTNSIDADWNKDTDSSLYIFLRYPSLERYRIFKTSSPELIFDDFELVDEKGNSVQNFKNRNGLEINEANGWLAFNVALTSGIYYLMYKGEEPRQVPIYVFQDWHTQFFMTIGHEPLFGTIRIFLSRDRYFEPNDPSLKYIDILLDKLQNNDFELDQTLIEEAAYGKFQSPMLGLICAYIYLKSKETMKDSLFRAITHNMQNTILKNNTEAPEIRALNILAAGHFTDHEFDKSPVLGTPMFRIGFEAILNAAVNHEKLIPPNTINDYITENLYFDSPYNTFKPVPFHKTISAISSLEKENAAGESSELESTVSEKTRSISGDYPAQEKYTKSIKALYETSLFDFIKNKNEEETHNSWVENAMADLIKDKDDLTINKISAELNVSGSTVSRIFDDWENELSH